MDRYWEQSLQKRVILISPLTPDNVEGFKDTVESEEETKEEQAEAPAAVEAAASVQGAVATVKGGKVVISIKEGKDITWNFLFREHMTAKWQRMS